MESRRQARGPCGGHFRSTPISGQFQSWSARRKGAMALHHIHQSADRPMIRSEPTPKCLLNAPDLACVQTSRWGRAGVPPIIEIGTNITQHSLPASAQLPATSRLGAFWRTVSLLPASKKLAQQETFADAGCHFRQPRTAHAKIPGHSACSLTGRSGLTSSLGMATVRGIRRTRHHARK
jgi:hypothetical protein